MHVCFVSFETGHGHCPWVTCACLGWPLPPPRPTLQSTSQINPPGPGPGTSGMAWPRGQDRLRAGDQECCPHTAQVCCPFSLPLRPPASPSPWTAKSPATRARSSPGGCRVHVHAQERGRLAPPATHWLSVFFPISSQRLYIRKKGRPTEVTPAGLESRQTAASDHAQHAPSHPLGCCSLSPRWMAATPLSWRFFEDHMK